MLGKEPEPETKIKEYWINLERDLALIETTYLKDKEFILNGELSLRLKSLSVIAGTYPLGFIKRYSGDLSLE